MHPHRFLAPILLGLAALSGCGPGVGQVSGKVYFRGEVLKSGTVIFIGSDGQPVHSPIRDDGSYFIEKSRVGPAKIGVVSHGRVPFPPARDEAPKIPDRYREPDQSRLTYEV